MPLAIRNFHFLRSISLSFCPKIQNPRITESTPSHTLPTPLKSPSSRDQRPVSMSSSSSSSSWPCKKCTFLNPPSAKPTCQICLSNSSPSPPASPATPKWACKSCTFLNPYRNSRCEICCTGASASKFDDLKDTTSDIDPSVGSVFFPLRACSSKRKREDRPIQDEGGDVGGGREDGVPVGEFRGIKASSKGVGEDRSSFLGLSSVKILSYNVWFREDLELHKRMKAIGDLIQLHSPDVICFQEVTPTIYEIFLQSSWWKFYCCSVSSADAYERPYFCMQLSKLPAKSFTCKPFNNSIMGRELCIAELEIPLVVATSHLESPCPAPPKWDQMYSKERVDQARELIPLLDKNPNVIFAGDTNWDDKLDGNFPLQEGWVDAWAHLRPVENGWTYDTKSNRMLSGNRTLQKRLDRIMCKLQDFKVSGIEMIGMEAIPGLSYCKEKKIGKEMKQLVLPVLPSDHYGLLLTISRQ
ncbi:uncharacterized protein LOC116206329 [Punica granatum]|uniref:Uncharacterized protein LOC116206329 n=2 Tax=Punica granatum TaxID=22663 RepID=A0A6P8DNX7_PUNGR|nr:uncharacterized protein LOC116206329 [Punica granatum]PKI79069.1 hypothetical protein CRG98_000550 [Punica granatum]